MRIVAHTRDSEEFNFSFPLLSGQWGVITAFCSPGCSAHLSVDGVKESDSGGSGTVRVEIPASPNSTRVEGALALSVGASSPLELTKPIGKMRKQECIDLLTAVGGYEDEDLEEWTVPELHDEIKEVVDDPESGVSTEGGAEPAPDAPTPHSPADGSSVALLNAVDLQIWEKTPGPAGRLAPVATLKAYLYGEKDGDLVLRFRDTRTGRDLK